MSPGERTARSRAMLLSAGSFRRPLAAWPGSAGNRCHRRPHRPARRL